MVVIGASALSAAEQQGIVLGNHQHHHRQRRHPHPHSLHPFQQHQHHSASSHHLCHPHVHSQSQNHHHRVHHHLHLTAIRVAGKVGQQWQGADVKTPGRPTPTREPAVLGGEVTTIPGAPSPSPHEPSAATPAAGTGPPVATTAATAVASLPPLVLHRASANASPAPAPAPPAGASSLLPNATLAPSTSAGAVHGSTPAAAVQNSRTQLAATARVDGEEARAVNTFDGAAPDRAVACAVGPTSGGGCRQRRDAATAAAAADRRERSCCAGNAGGVKGTASRREEISEESDHPESQKEKKRCELLDQLNRLNEDCWMEKDSLYREQLELLERELRELREGTHKEFLVGVCDLEAERSQLIQDVGYVYQYEVEFAERLCDAEVQEAQEEYENDIHIVQERISNDIEDRRRKAREEIECADVHHDPVNPQRKRAIGRVIGCHILVQTFSSRATAGFAGPAAPHPQHAT